MTDRKSEAIERLEEQRRALENTLANVRQAVSRETGWSPGNNWLIPLVGFACGVALAIAVTSRRRDP